MYNKNTWIISLLLATIMRPDPVNAGTCTDDAYEIQGRVGTDDICWGAEITDPQEHQLCDDDWAWFRSQPNTTYRIETSNLTGNTNTVLSLHENCGVAVAANDDFDGLASRIEWTSERGGVLDIRISGFDGDYNAGGGYTLSVECIANCVAPDGIFLNSFEHVPIGPDLVVMSPAVSNAVLVTSQAFTLSAIVRNQGTTAAGAVALRYYLSADSVINTADHELGTDEVSGLPAATDTAQDFAASAPGPGNQGSYWVGACIDSVAGETNTANQCSAGVAITVLRDSDGDRLPDAVETWTGVYVDPSHTGTNPNDADTDDDGIKDGDEVLGTLAGLDLPALGVSPVRKDLLLEYDWFDDTLCGYSHSHRPTPASIAPVVAAFANSPVANVGNSDGVNMINDYGQGGVFTGGNLINDPNGVIAEGVSEAEYQAHKAANFAANRNGYFHYVLLPHRYDRNSGSSGQAEYPGDDMVVSLVCYGTDARLANTILHELGHNLYLHHGGNVTCNYKPNYNSVMNYKYQFDGVDDNCTPSSDGVTDYSYGDRPALNETALNELTGICGPGFPWDWNGNGVAEPVIAFNVNPYDDELAECGSIASTLSDYNDWGNLYFGGTGDANGLSPIARQIISEQWVPDEITHKP